jgi:hypothetical protein
MRHFLVFSLAIYCLSFEDNKEQVCISFDMGGFVGLSCVIRQKISSTSILSFILELDGVLPACYKV